MHAHLNGSLVADVIQDFVEEKKNNVGVFTVIIEGSVFAVFIKFLVLGLVCRQMMRQDEVLEVVSDI